MSRTPASPRWNRRRNMIMLDFRTQCKEAPAKNDGGQSLLGITILELRLVNCRYIVSSNEDHGAMFCGAVVHKVSYCRAHYALCYITPSKAAEASQPVG